MFAGTVFKDTMGSKRPVDLACCVIRDKALVSHALWLRVELYTRNPDNAATACRHSSTHLWHQTYAAFPPSIILPSGWNPNKPAPFTSLPSITLCLLHWINSVEIWRVHRRCFCLPGICLWSGEPGLPWSCGCIFKFGMCLNILDLGAAYQRINILQDPPFPPPPHTPATHSSTHRGGSESPHLPAGGHDKNCSCNVLIDRYLNLYIFIFV